MQQVIFSWDFLSIPKTLQLKLQFFPSIPSIAGLQHPFPTCTKLLKINLPPVQKSLTSKRQPAHVSFVVHSEFTLNLLFSSVTEYHEPERQTQSRCDRFVEICTLCQFPEYTRSQEREVWYSSFLADLRAPLHWSSWKPSWISPSLRANFERFCSFKRSSVSRPLFLFSRTKGFSIRVHKETRCNPSTSHPHPCPYHSSLQ